MIGELERLQPVAGVLAAVALFHVVVAVSLIWWFVRSRLRLAIRLGLVAAGVPGLVATGAAGLIIAAGMDGEARDRFLDVVKFSVVALFGEILATALMTGTIASADAAENHAGA